MANSPNEFHLLWFDPGGTTGWAYFELNRRAYTRPEHKVLANVNYWTCGELTGTENEIQNAAQLLLLSHSIWDGPFQPDVHYGTEDFDLAQTVGGKTLLSPVRINAVLDWEVSKLGRKLIYQNRALRTNMTAQRMSAAGFNNPMRPNGAWSKTGRSKDAFAAMQHAVVYLRRLKETSRGRPWKLADEQSANARWDCACESGKRCDLRHP